jgi:hypothetical protein
MNEGTRSGKSKIRLLDISAERPTNGLYLYLTPKERTPFNSLVGVPVGLTAGMEDLENRKGFWLCQALKASPSVS